MTANLISSNRLRFYLTVARRSYVFALVLLAPNLTFAGLPVARPEQSGMRAEALDHIDAIVQEGLDAKRMPGCVVMLGRGGKIVFHRAYGHRQLQPTKEAMTKDTVFDMASITKPVATATSVMILLEQGKIRLRDKVSTYIPKFATSGKEEITVAQLLTHQAGFVPDNALADYQDGRRSAFENIYQLETMYAPGERFVYSDVGFILLDDLIERQSGKTVAAFSQEHIFEPLGMHESGYLPAASLRQRTAATEEREGRWMRGEVHDPRAYLMAGVAGHAGLFSTAQDMAIYAQMMLNGGHYGGKRILSGATVELMTDNYRIVEGEKVSLRGLGWDKLTGYSSNRGENMSPQAFGHGGFTGTVLWIDPAHDLFFIFLSNRVHPAGSGSVNRLAGRIATIAVGAIDDDLLPTPGPTQKQGQVSTGIDVLEQSDYQTLRGQRIGLITNQTGVNHDGKSTIALLHEAKDVQLTALFSPEHGLAGKLDQSIIGDAVDRDSGIKVYSLYGETRQPTAEQLAAIDTLVFDIQDIGCRFYTYISTMGLAMQAAAEHGKRFVVLDRPNPIDGTKIDGPMLDDGRESFVGFHSLPIQHGMTVGEIAMMFKQELKLSQLDLQVIRCQNWSRSQYFDQTGLHWINPSPNMRNLNEAILYPGIGVWETTNLSVGRGTDTPFEIVGAPWIDAGLFAKVLNAAQIPGVQFTPRRFTPTASKFANEECGGVQISITNRDAFRSIRCGIALACALRQLYPQKWEFDKSMRLLGSQAVLDAIDRIDSTQQIMQLIEADVSSFFPRRSLYLLY